MSLSGIKISFVIVKKTPAASFRPAQPIFVATRSCFDAKDGREAIRIARHLLLTDPDLVAYGYAGLATALGGDNKRWFHRDK